MLFELERPRAGEVLLAGAFSRWGTAPLPMEEHEGAWRLRLALDSGLHEYKFIVDGQWITDPDNPALSVAGDGGRNSVFWKHADGRLEQRAEVPDTLPLDGDSVLQPVNLVLIWQHHQPYMGDPVRDELLGPWVRLHATKDYFDMGLRLQRQPTVQACLSFSGTLLFQLQRHYLERLVPFLDHEERGVTQGFRETWGGRTDPWVDLLLQHTVDPADSLQAERLWKGAWSCLSISPELLARFPQYEELVTRIRGGHSPDAAEAELLLAAFTLAWCDPILLREAVPLPGGRHTGFHELVEALPEGRWRIPSAEPGVRERLVYESGLLMEAILPLHRDLGAPRDESHGPQVELATTPFAHPILPLLNRTEAARARQPEDELPRFGRPDWARRQVELGREQFRKAFGFATEGFWPGEGAIDLPVLEMLGATWTATGDAVFDLDTPGVERGEVWIDLPTGECMVLLRATELSRALGWRYRHYPGEAAAVDLANRLLALGRKKPGQAICLVLDGENAWEFYRRDHDADRFLDEFYGLLAKDPRFRTWRPSEWRAARLAAAEASVDAVSPERVSRENWLPAGSWIGGDLRTWIGEEEENRAWEWLARCAEAAERCPEQPQPREGLDAGTALLLAQGSDWFWWYGQDRRAFEGDRMWDRLFLDLLRRTQAGCEQPLSIPESLLEEAYGRMQEQPAGRTLD